MKRVDYPQVYVRFYYEGELSENLQTLWNLAMGEIDKDFELDHVFDGKMERVDSPEKPPLRGRLAYEQKE